MVLAKMMGPRNFKVIKDAPDPGEIKKGEALILVGGSGICGSDMHPYLGESISATYDRVPGHEFSGIVAEIKADDTDIKKGDKVMINPTVYCGSCYYCDNGYGYMCEQCEVIGGERPGAFCDKIIVPVSTLTKLPPDTDLIEACLIEPVAFAEHCTSGIEGKNVVVVGQGAIGLLCSMLLKYKGNTVISLDISDYQLELSKKLCSDLVINTKNQDAEQEIKRFLGDKKVDIIIDTVYNEKTFDFNLQILKRTGLMMLVGVPTSKFKFNTIKLLLHEITVQTKYLYPNDAFAKAVDYVINRKIDVRPLISKVFPMESIQEAFEYKASTPSIKVVLQGGCI